MFLGEVKTIKYGEIFAISSDVSEKQSIVYTSDCIESARIEQYNPDKQLNDNCSSHTWNEEDDVFDQQLETLGVRKLFSDNSEPVKRELRDYIEGWERFPTKKNDQRTRTNFLYKYGGLPFYDIYFGKRSYIDDGDIHFVK